jgi:hypothetical protein
VRPMHRDYLIFLVGVFCVVEEMFRIAYYPSLGSCVVLEPLEVFGGFGEGFGIAILGVEIMVTFLPSLPFIQVVCNYPVILITDSRELMSEMVWMYL